MIRVKAVAGVCVLCAIAFSAVAVQSAAAAGTTGFTCKEAKEPGVGFSDAHCNTAVGTGAKFEHVGIPENAVTEGRVTNANTASGTTASTTAKLKGSISGVVVELQATGTEGLATGTNKNNGAEHFIEGTGVTTYTGVTVTQPAGKGCVVTGGQITTNELRGTSLGQGDRGKLEPASGAQFATIPISGCSVSSLNNNFPITGSITCPASGSTIACTHAETTAQSTLKFGGTKAGIEVVTTATGRANSSEPWTPLAPTTQ